MYVFYLFKIKDFIPVHIKIYFILLNVLENKYNIKEDWHFNKMKSRADGIWRFSDTKSDELYSFNEVIL